MNVFLRMARFRLWSDRASARAGQFGCYAAAVAVFMMALKALARLGATPVEMLIGMLATCGLAVGMVALGTITAMQEEIRRR